MTETALVYSSKAARKEMFLAVREIELDLQYKMALSRMVNLYIPQRTNTIKETKRGDISRKSISTTDILHLKRTWVSMDLMTG